MTRPCTTHHNACDCREAARAAEIAELNRLRADECRQYALDAAEVRAAHDRRVTELLEANNREVERRRIAERRVVEFEGK